MSCFDRQLKPGRLSFSGRGSPISPSVITAFGYVENFAHFLDGIAVLTPKWSLDDVKLNSDRSGHLEGDKSLELNTSDKPVFAWVRPVEINHLLSGEMTTLTNAKIPAALSRLKELQRAQLSELCWN